MEDGARPTCLLSTEESEQGGWGRGIAGAYLIATLVLCFVNLNMKAQKHACFHVNFPFSAYSPLPCNIIIICVVPFRSFVG